jgi:hypothetical protein
VEELKRFAESFEVVCDLVESGQYAAMLEPAIRLVKEAASEQASRRRQQSELAQCSEMERRLSKFAETILAHQTVPQPAPTATSPVELAGPPQSKVWTIAGNSLATHCRPKMHCIEAIIESPKVVTDVVVSSACPVDVMVSSQSAQGFDWLVYAPAGKGADVHGASFPLEAKRTFIAAMTQAKTKNLEPLLDVRCAITTVWHDARDLNVESRDQTPQQKARDAIPDPPAQMPNPYH